MARTWTVKEVLATAETLADESRGRPSRHDLAWCLAETLGVDRLGLLMQPERPLGEDERGRFRERLTRLFVGEPLAYVLGHQDFRGHRFEVGPEVLIPRPETEELVDHALTLLPEGARVFEPCTGSGCIGISLLLARPDLEVLSSDLSYEALVRARANATALLPEGALIGFCEGSYWEAAGARQFEALVANPPHVDPGRPDLLDEQVARYEPGMALFAEGGTYAAYDALLAGGLEGLLPGALVLMETGVDTAEGLLARVMRSDNYEQAEILEDLAGRPRFLRARRAGA